MYFELIIYFKIFFLRKYWNVNEFFNLKNLWVIYYFRFKNSCISKKVIKSAFWYENLISKLEIKVKKLVNLKKRLDFGDLNIVKHLRLQRLIELRFLILYVTELSWQISPLKAHRIFSNLKKIYLSFQRASPRPKLGVGRGSKFHG